MRSQCIQCAYSKSCECWPMKKAESQRTDAFILCWRRLLRAPWTTRRSHQSTRKEISLGYSLDGLMLKLKLQYFGHLMRTKSQLIGKDLDAGKDWKQKKRGTDDEMVGWHHWLSEHDLSKLQEIVKVRKASCTIIHGVTKSQIRLSDWTTRQVLNKYWLL